LNGADRVVFLVTGSDEAETLAAVLEGPRQPDLYPSQVISPRAFRRFLLAGDPTRGIPCASAS